MVRVVDGHVDQVGLRVGVREVSGTFGAAFGRGEGGGTGLLEDVQDAGPIRLRNEGLGVGVEHR